MSPFSAVGGGAFAVPKTPWLGSSAPPFLGAASLLLVNARSGAQVLEAKLKPTRVWLPSYLCGSLKFTSPVRYYEIDEDLELGDRGWLGELRGRDLVVLVDYFGYRPPASVFEACRAAGSWILEDASQALLTDEVGEGADFTLFSPRKFLGVPDGGILNGYGPSTIALESAPAPWFATALKAVTLESFAAFQQAECDAPSGPFRMSALSESLLKEAFCYPAIAAQRRANYLTLQSRLNELAVFPRLEDGVVPLAFPIESSQRDELRQHLINGKIYPMIHWNLGGVVPAAFVKSHRLSQRILSLPCDQRYGAAEMERIIDSVKLFFFG